MVQVYGADNEHNSLTVDFTFGGFFSVPGGISFSGGAGGDYAVRIIGNGQTTGSYTPDGSTPGNGTAQVFFGSQSVNVSFAGLQPIEVSGMATYELVTPNSGNNVTVAAGTSSGGQAAEVISGTSGGVQIEALTFFGTPAFTLDTATNDGANPDDVINVKATLAGTTTTISTGGGNDTVNVGSLAPGTGGITDNISGPLVVTTDPGTTLNVDDTGSTGAKTGFLTSSTITGLGMAGGITYSGTKGVNVSLGSGNDIVNIQSTTAATTINGGDAFDVFNVGALAPASGGYLSQLDGAVFLNGASGGNTTMVIDDQLNPASETYTLTSTTFASPIAALITYSGLQGINIDGGTGNDTLVVDSSGGLVDVANGIHYDAGTGFNTLQLIQTSGPMRTSDTYGVGPNPGSGTSVISDPSGTQSVFFEFLAPVTDLVPATVLTVNGTASNNTINYEQGPNSGNPSAPYNGDSTGLVTVDNSEPLEFSHKSTLTLQGENGDDTFVVNNTSAPTGLTAIDVNGQLGNNTLVVDANNQPVISSMITSSQVNVPLATPVAISYGEVEQVRVINAKDALSSSGAAITGAGNGSPLVNVLVGEFQFTDPVPPSVWGYAQAFTATINWGDGTAPTAGTIVQSGPGAAGQVIFQVFGTHTYTTVSPLDAPYQVTVAVTDNGSTRSFTPANGVLAQIVDNPGATTSTTPVIVDTRGPVIDGAFFNRLNGQVDYIIADPGARHRVCGFPVYSTRPTMS